MDQNKPTFIKETKSKVWTKAVMPFGKSCPKHPYVKMFQFRENVYSFFERSFDGKGDPWMHLIVGPEKALLIDNGFGIGDLRGTVEDIIGDMPLYVTNTHASIDHSWGNFQFDRVHVIKYAVPYLQKYHPHQWDHLWDPKTGRGIWQDFDPKDIVPFKDYEIVPCENNYIFDLGQGYEVEMIHLPGHMCNHCVFLDKTNRILFGGDSLLYICAISNNRFQGEPYDEYGTVEGLKIELEKLVKRLDEFDVVFMSHMVLGEDKQIVVDMYNACKDIVNDPDCNQFVNRAKDGTVTAKVHARGMAAVAYTSDRVYKSQSLYNKPTFIREWQSGVWGRAITPLGKVYPVFPYGRVFKFRDNVYSIRVRSVWISIVVGPEKAMVIDTGYGVGDLKGLIEELIGDMPYIVVNTHSHGDHTLGNMQFDEVYCHEHAVPVLQQAMDEEEERRWRFYGEPIKEVLKGTLADMGGFRREDAVPFKPYKIIGCANNTVFNLGGDYDIEMILVPGHDASNVAYLDKKNRILFGGDTLLYVAGVAGKPGTKLPYGEYATVEALAIELEKLVKRLDEFDCIFMGHMHQGGDKKLVRDLYEACTAVVRDPDCNDYVAEKFGVPTKVKAYGIGAVEYTDGKVYMKDNM